MIEITGLWLNKSKEGESYMVGYLGGARVLIFKNKYKDDDKHPDYQMFIVKQKKKDDSENEDSEKEADVPF